MVSEQSGTVFNMNDCNIAANYKNKLEILVQKRFEIKHLAWHTFLYYGNPLL